MKNYLKQVLFVSTIFLLYQAIFNTQMSILGQFAYQKGDSLAGSFINALFFLGSGIGSFRHSYLKKYHYKWIFITGSLGSLGYMCFSIIFLQYGFSKSMTTILYVSSFLCGMIASIFYNAQFNYVNCCSKSDQETTKYFGFNLGIVQSANIFGSALSAMLIIPFGQHNYAIFMGVMLFGVTTLFLFVKDVKYIEPTKQIEVEQLIDEAKTKAQKKQLTKNQQKQQTVYQVCCSFIFSGIILSFVYNQISTTMYQSFQTYNQVKLNRLTFVVLIFQGLGQLLGGVYIIFISSKTSSVISQFSIFGNIFLISVALFYIAASYQNILLLYFSVLMIGISDCVCFSLALSMAGKWNQKGIGIFSAFQSLSISIMILITLLSSIEIAIGLSVISHIASTACLLSSKRVK